MTPGAVLVTGANGFVGRAVCAYLAHRGYCVRALVRRRECVPGAAEVLVLPELSDIAALRPLVDGADAVVHLAARVHSTADSAAEAAAEFCRVNVDFTRRLAETAAAVGARSFVFASSVKAVGEERDEPITVETPASPVDAYGASKLEAERALTEVAAATDLRAVTIRFPVMFGPGMKGNMLQLFHLVECGIPLPLASVQNRRSIVFVGNAAAGVEQVLRDPDARGVFPFEDGPPIATPDLIRAIASALHRPARLLRTPPTWLMRAGRVGDALARLGWATFTSKTVRHLVGSLVVDGTSFRHTTGFVAPFSLSQGLALSASWYHEERALRRRRQQAIA